MFSMIPSQKDFKNSIYKMLTKHWAEIGRRKTRKKGGKEENLCKYSISALKALLRKRGRHHRKTVIAMSDTTTGCYFY